MARQAERDRRYARVLEVRAEVATYLRGLGAYDKPPMPDVLDEDPGAPPLDGAVWIAGEWTWRGGAWVWLGGGWTIPDVTRVVVGVDVGGHDAPRPTVVDHRDGAPDRGRVEDHRDAPRHERPQTRDHRDDDRDRGAAAQPTTRDHRDEPRAKDAPRPSDDREDRERPRRRDHR